jgi:hypothetical protein
LHRPHVRSLPLPSLCPLSAVANASWSSSDSDAKLKQKKKYQKEEEKGKGEICFWASGDEARERLL